MEQRWQQAVLWAGFAPPAAWRRCYGAPRTHLGDDQAGHHQPLRRLAPGRLLGRLASAHLADRLCRHLQQGVQKCGCQATFELPLDYTAYIIAGYLPWMALAESLAKSCRRHLRPGLAGRAVVFPVEVLPIKSILAAVLTQLIGLAFLLGYIVVMHGQVYASWLLLPPLLIMQCVLTGGLALLLSALGAYFRDMKDLMAVFCLANVYLMPIFFLPEWVPANLKPILLLDPFSHVVSCYQDVCYSAASSILVVAGLSRPDVVCLLAATRSSQAQAHVRERPMSNQKQRAAGQFPSAAAIGGCTGCPRQCTST